MKIQLLSDLHIEFWKQKFRITNPHNANVLVLAGDIAVGVDKVAGVLITCSKEFPHVVYLPGNHEFYGHTLESFEFLKSLVPANVYILNPGCIKLDDVTFIGAPLWTNFRARHPSAMKAAKDMISDFRLIKDFSPAVAAALFDEHFQFIKCMYENTPGKKVIVTHFLPATECISPRFQGEGLLNYYFANDLGEWIKELKNTTWMFGHTHDSMDFLLGETRVLCNPYGYRGHEINKQHNPDLIINV